MKTKSRLLSLSIAFAFAAGVFGVLISTDSGETVSATRVDASVPIPAPTVGRTNELKVVASGGLRVATFEAPSGKVYLYLPDDMRAGDTISGTVKTEPKGQTDEERAKNLETLNGYTITLWPNPLPKKPGEGVLRLPVRGSTFTIPQGFVQFPFAGGTFGNLGQGPGAMGNLFGFPGFNATLGPPIAQGSGGNFDAENFPGVGSVVSGIIPGAVIATTGIEAPLPTTAVIPPLGQQGRSVEIFGPFDGDATNTFLSIKPLPNPSLMPPAYDLDRTDRTPSYVWESPGLRPLAESPRKIVFESPTNFTGPAEIVIKDGNTETRAPYRNLGVQLIAPKTNLMRGEKTTLTVEVRGLEGIKEDVPLQLDAQGVITMEGGMFQNLRIKPQEVKPDGRYTTTRAITGQQAGGFSVTATVIVRRFDFCLQDDFDPNRLFYFNSFTGDYLFACGGGSCRPGGSTGGTQTGGTTTGKPGGTTQPGGTVQPGGTPPGGTAPPPIQPSGITLTGIGRPTMKGCIITLSHNAPDRRVFARLDACTKTGDASVQPPGSKTPLTITDKNITDSTAPSPRPK